MDILQEQFCVEISGLEKSLMDISQEPFDAVIYRKNAGPQFPARHFVRACAVETHMEISQKPFCVEIYRKNAGPPSAHLD